MLDAQSPTAVDALLRLIRDVVPAVAVDGLDAADAAGVVERCAEGERLLAALRIRAAATLEDKALWRRAGFRSAAAWMAARTGTAVGPALTALETAGRLDGLPLLAAAFREGGLSEAQTAEIAVAAAAAPEAEGRLVDAAAKLSLRALREECRRTEAAADADTDQRHWRVHRSRRVRTWVDAHGVGRLSARLTPDELAVLAGEIDHRYDAIVTDALRGGWFESPEAHRADALVELARGDGHRPGAVVHVVVDHDALLRGHATSGERCEIPGVGPIPVAVAHRLAGDAFLKVLVTKGVDIAAVAHGGRTIPTHLRTALELRDPTCVVPRCTVRRGLQIDHRDSYARTGITSLDNTARLCRWHHYQKTFLGYSYRGGPGTWQWIPPEQHDQDLTTLRPVITPTRRC